MIRKKTPEEPAEPDDDGALFRRAVAGARPLGRDVAEAPRRRPAPRARRRRADDAGDVDERLDGDVDERLELCGERLSFRRPEVGPRTLRRLARGHYSVQADIDLHGMTAAEAEQALAAFLEHSVLHGHRCVRVVHGKGLGSGLGGPVLKPRVYRLLQRRRDVLACVSARQVDGGTGAVYVLLRQAS